ncbi:MAG TPA: hypothetical protein VFW84_14115 [Aquabacterium sp.]|uniref:hypothetical protein n=1 Tax=Aquabacterium sp. TaxID=1872578 RepID=UPI002E2F8C50|nr:hypothetical protein [Aquabacterium sp.]HEX5373857.1 hypothetical protein [Aquabacterium sp.]
MTKAPPFYIATTHRRIAQAEREVLLRILQDLKSKQLLLVDDLEVVGRCGCGSCPTIFFQPQLQEEPEKEVASYFGQDETGAPVGVLLWEINGRPSQLEFYSVDGHDPWHIPRAETLEPF